MITPAPLQRNERFTPDCPKVATLDQMNQANRIASSIAFCCR